MSVRVPAFDADGNAARLQTDALDQKTGNYSGFAASCENLRLRSEGAARTLEISGCIDARMRRAPGDRDGDAKTMRERAQLLERLEALDRGGSQARELAQESRAIRIDSEVTVDRQAARYRADAACES